VARRLAILLGSLAITAVLPSPAVATPTCAEGPQTVGATIYGTPCADTIHVPRGVTAVYGEGGDDTIYGGRGNQSIYGGPGNDRLYGGIGDDHLRGGPGNDLLSGGFGADSLDGEEGSDLARGDATIDYLGDSGSTGTDTVSFATGATPGFGSIGPASEYEGFPPVGGERGVYIDLTQKFAYDGKAPEGGGVDKPLPPAEDFEAFETVFGTPFSDVIVGGPGPETIYGGGGADVILAGAEENHLHGGAGGDYCEGAGELSSCEFSGGEKKVELRDPSQIAVGMMSGGGEWPVGVYLDGSDGADEVSATYSSKPPRVSFEILGGGGFDAAEAEAGECELPTATKAVCPLAEAPDSIDLAGLGGDDSLSAHEFPPSTSIVELGGNNADHLTGTEAEDVLVDGPGNDHVSAAGADDALPNNQGTDDLFAGPGNDLFISDAVCEGDVLDGGEGRDNANWANFEFPVSLDLAIDRAGLLGAGGMPDCAGDPETTLHNLEDIEATNLEDTLIGDAGENQLLGRRGSDSYHAGPGNDTILANSGYPTPDPDPAIDCGEGFDTAEIDYPENGPDAVPVDCEAVFERAPNSFRPAQTPPGPEPEAEPNPPIPAPPEPVDTTSPRTHLLHRPAKVVRTRAHRRTVAFVFSSNELGSGFRCKLDHGPFKACRSPRRYRVGPGPHAFRVFAVDAAGNADRSPVVFRFRVARLSDRSSRSHRHRVRTR
jgi:Ca2+-binding RTX toxin-like protein